VLFVVVWQCGGVVHSQWCVGVVVTVVCWCGGHSGVLVWRGVDVYRGLSSCVFQLVLVPRVCCVAARFVVCPLP
jgi:hypothetical protein